ncbi:hypothetical protein Tco_0671041 [Tanacetum coccineum]
MGRQYIKRGKPLDIDRSHFSSTTLTIDESSFLDFRIAKRMPDSVDLCENVYIIVKWSRLVLARSVRTLILRTLIVCWFESMDTKGSLLSTFASKVKNINGRTLGKDNIVTVPEDVPTSEVLNTPKDGFDTINGKSGNGGADVAIPLAAIGEVSNWFVNTLYGYFIGKRIAFPIVENYVKNIWAKYGLERVMLNKLRRPIMLDAYTSTVCLKSWRRNTYAWDLIEVSSKMALMDSLVVVILFQNGSGHSMETIDIEYEWQPPRCDKCKIFHHIDDQWPKKVKLTKPKPNYFYRVVSKLVNVNDEAFTSQPKGNKKAYSQPKSNVHNNGKPIDDLVDDARKKGVVPPKKTPRKTGIWSDRKANSPKRNVFFSPETKVHYFNRDDMNFDDMGQAVEEVKH